MIPWAYVSLSSGCHQKTASLLDDKDIRRDLREFLQAHLNRIQPHKIQKWAEGKVEEAAGEFSNEMATTLQQRLVDSILPRLNLNTRTVSSSTARRWLRKEGFRYAQIKKGVYLE